MTAVFRTFDTNGVNLIDSRYLMYGYYGKYQVTRAASIRIPIVEDDYFGAYPVGDYYLPIGYIDVPSSISPVLFVGGGRAKPFSIVRINSTTLRCYFGLALDVKGNVGALVPDIWIYVFDRFAKRATGVGLNLYDSTGTLTFSTSTPPLNLTGTYTPIDSTGYFPLRAYVATTNVTTPNIDESRLALTAGRKYAVYTTNMGRPRTLLSSGVGYYMQETGYGGTGFISMYFGYDTRALFAYEAYVANGWTAPATAARPCFYIDVTDL